MFQTINDVYEFLYQQKELSRKKDLSRISFVAKELDVIPTYPIIHIAGTNGKGSTACTIKNILKNTGRHVGLFISPFVISFNERIEINDRFISDAEIMHYGTILEEYSRNYFIRFNDVIPFFELTLLMALMFYKDRQIDLAVIECGIGGALDATNFLKTDLAIITSIGYDHQAILGNTKENIALAKLGIVKTGMICLCSIDDDIKPLFRKYGEDHQAKIIFVDEMVKVLEIEPRTKFLLNEVAFVTPLLSAPQAYNASLAIMASKIIEPSIPHLLLQDGLDQTSFPGRLEVIQKEPLILLDGAHNISAIQKLTDYLLAIKKGRRIKVLFSSLRDKNYSLMLKELDKVVDGYYFTTLNDSRASNENEFGQYTQKPYLTFSNEREAYEKAFVSLQKDEILVVTGSLHFVSSIRSFLKK